MSSAWIETVLELMRRHGIAEFEYEDANRHVAASEGEAFDLAEPAHQRAPPPHAGATVMAPHIGIFQAALAPDGREAPLPRLVKQGEIVGYLKAGALLRPVVAPSDGVLSHQLADDGILAGYGTPLFELHTAAF